jgi:hypothetical protein
VKNRKISILLFFSFPSPPKEKLRIDVTRVSGKGGKLDEIKRFTNIF